MEILSKEKKLINGFIFEQTLHFNYIKCDITQTHSYQKDISNMLHEFVAGCRTIQTTVRGKATQGTQLTLYKVSAISIPCMEQRHG
jgi:hypothetical protein